ncbi:hypothetical protein Y032_0011g1288 [Ancylostoma ceylanicum]|uniref:CID domain-containing protein n=1 Tax=Ancylostoma ceylanicum TaxID=53326 RepID=A0A016VDX6_9BILA|nr:hypothetical protein Y032_0011g1288 [Ancylostoma ceylanicum]
MTGLTMDAVMRRFQDIHSVSQEAIETISLWVMHYKDKRSIDVIVEAWLESFKIAKKDEQRIALFYVMNDVVQRAKNKHMDVLIPAFQPAVLSAVSMGKGSPSVKQVMSRCIDIFGERQVFTEASVNVMKNMLQSEENGDGDESFAELDSEEVFRKIELFERGRLIVNRGMEVIRNGDFDCKALMKERMRDRTVAAQLVMETQQVLSQIASFRHSMEEQKRKMLQLIETLELAKRNFSHQLKDVTVVEDAYQKYFQGIQEVHADLLEMEKSGVYPAATPPRDAPSPTANDDIYATGVENALQTFRVPGSRDNLESTDMELDDDSAPIDVGGTSPLSGNLPPPPAPPVVLEARPPGGVPCPQPGVQLPSNGNAVPQHPGGAAMPPFQARPPYGAAQPPFAPPPNMSVPPPNASQPPPGFPPNATQPQPPLVLPPSITSQPPPNIQALLKSIPSLQTIQQATAAAAAAAAASGKPQNPPPMNFPPPVVQQRFGDVDERLPPVAAAQAPQGAPPPVPGYHQMQQPPPVPVAAPAPPAAFHQQQQPRLQPPAYAEEGPSHVDYQKPGPGGAFEQQNGDGQYHADGDKDGFYHQPPPQFQNNGPPFSPHNRGRPRGGGSFGHGRGDQWRKSNDFRGGRGFGGPRGGSFNRGRGGFHGGGGFQGGNFQRGRGRGNWNRDEY